MTMLFKQVQWAMAARGERGSSIANERKKMKSLPICKLSWFGTFTLLSPATCLVSLVMTWHYSLTMLYPSWKVCKKLVMKIFKDWYIVIKAYKITVFKILKFYHIVHGSEWLYVTRWYLCCQSLLHWSTWVIMQSLLRLRHNGYWSLGWPT